MFKSLSVFRVGPEWAAPSFETLSDALARRAFGPCGPTDRLSAGWLPPRGVAHGPLLESVAGHWLMSLAVETRLLPASAVREELEERLEAIEHETGRRLRGKSKRELKEQIEHELLPRAFTRRSRVLVWLDPRSRTLVLDTTSSKWLDVLGSELQEVFEGGLPIAPVQTRLSPSVAMSQWLIEREAPAGFTVDRDCELRLPDDTKATVKYLRHALDSDEVATHLQAGKVPVHLAMTWASRVSFVLTDDARIKRLKFLETTEPTPEGQGRPEDDFDANVALATGDLGQLLVDLIEALGGEPEPGEGPAPF